MKRKTFFMTDNALDVKNKILKKILPKHMLYGGLELEESGKAKILNYNLKNIFGIRKNSIVVTNRLKHVILMKFLGLKVVLINMNSNHDLTKKTDLKGKFIYLFNKISYRLCDRIVCLSKIQLKKLEEIKAKKISVIPLGVDKPLIDKIRKSKKYFLSSGFDKGKDHDFVKKALKGFNLKILDGKKPLPYERYLKILGKAKAIVLNLNVEKEDSSDLSGTTTCFEALLMEKPIFINNQSWLKELYVENYYVYKNEEDLRKLIKKPIVFKKLNYSYLTLSNFTKELHKIINNI